jgi:anthranilate phosphoribosyltransferase
MKPFILKLKRNENLLQSEIEEVMQSIMSGDAPKEEIATFLMALREKGATVEEITGAAQVMRKFAVKIRTKHKDILDTCGTGGDKKGTFNISTITAFVVAGAGCIVAKHGNRSMSSKCGSADLLEGLGVNISLNEEELSECLDQVGIAFLFAQRMHPAMKNVAQIRKELGVETIFNLLGPLTNPAGATHQMMGVYNHDLVDPMAHVLQNLGSKRAIVVHGADGLDEITTTGETFISELSNNEVIDYHISPDELGVDIAKEEDFRGGDIETNMSIARTVLSGEKGPKRDIVLVNAAYGLYVDEKVTSVTEGMELAAKTIDSGRAKSKLEELVEFTNRKKT